MVGGGGAALFNEELVRAIEEYVSTWSKADNPVRHRREMGPPIGCEPHGGSGVMTRDSDCLTTADQIGKRDARPSALKGSPLIHLWFAAQVDNKTHDIKWGHGPAETYQTKKGIQALLEFVANSHH